ncbi:hypothetical protein ABT297_34315 [Dactylosporangium sp. NPDC000555]|uniref:hypothetical protein n=1 Tax=Dactylosporangium sp. NPDC000555 TaxID=3154260 RepID=UPI0033240DC2
MRRWYPAAVLAAVMVMAAGCTTDPKKATRNVDAAMAAALGIPVADVGGAGVRSDPGSLPVPCLDVCPSATLDLPAGGGEHPEWTPVAVLERLLAQRYTVVSADAPYQPPATGSPAGPAGPSAEPPDADPAARCRRVLPVGGACTLLKQVMLRLYVDGDTFSLRANGG